MDGFFQMAGADRLAGAGAGTEALLDLHLLLGFRFHSPFFHFLCLSDFSDLLLRRRPHISPPLSHQSLGGSAQMLGRRRAQSLDPLDVVHCVWLFLELTGGLAPSVLWGCVLPGGVRKRLVSLQLALMTHGCGTADDEDHDNEERGNNDDDEQVLLQEVHHSGQDEVSQADHGGGDGVGDGGGEARRLSDHSEMNRRSGGEGRGKDELLLGFITAAVHGDVVKQRSGMRQTAAEPEQSRAGDVENQVGPHLQPSVLEQQQ